MDNDAIILITKEKLLLDGNSKGRNQWGILKQFHRRPVHEFIAAAKASTREDPGLFQKGRWWNAELRWCRERGYIGLEASFSPTQSSMPTSAIPAPLSTSDVADRLNSPTPVRPDERRPITSRPWLLRLVSRHRARAASTTAENADAICRTIYAETREFYEQIGDRCGDLGFKILYSPPLLRPPILFIGYQPGGGADDDRRERASGAHRTWPPTCEYAVEQWKLADSMQRMFGRKLLERCVALNAIFIRAPNLETYRRTVEPTLRTSIEEFCLPRVTRIVSAIRPERIVAIGFETLELFGGCAPDLLNEKHRTLTRRGTIASRDAIATLHLSGARISNADRKRIADRIAKA